MTPREPPDHEEQRSRGLLEAFAPTPDATEVHRIEIGALPGTVYRCLWRVDFGRSPVVAGLLLLRALPTLLHDGGSPMRSRSLTLHEIEKAGFGRLAEDPEREIVFGVTGRFWRLTGNLEPFDREAFSKPVPAGRAHAFWSFRVLPRGELGSTLSTETRVTCGDPASRARFRRYWLVVRPFSGLIRIVMLQAIRRAAERSSQGAGPSSCDSGDRIR